MRLLRMFLVQTKMHFVWYFRRDGEMMFWTLAMPVFFLVLFSFAFSDGSQSRSSAFLVPGIILFTFVGLAPLLAAAITVRRRAFAPLAAVAVGLTLIGWVSVEMVVLAGPGSLAWALYLVLGVCIAAIGVAWLRSSRMLTQLAEAQLAEHLFSKQVVCL